MSTMFDGQKTLTPLIVTLNLSENVHSIPFGSFNEMKNRKNSDSDSGSDFCISMGYHEWIQSGLELTQK